MHFISTLAAGSLCLALSFSMPLSDNIDIPVARPTGGFTVHQVPSNSKIQRIGASERLKTLQKFGAVVPDHVKVAATAAKKKASAADAQQSGAVATTPEVYDQEYLCPVSIGTPAQTLNLNFDTGSSDLWVFSGKQPAKQLAKHKYYKIAQSKSRIVASGSTWDITYGDSSGARGVVFTDKVVVGPVTATKQVVEAATYVSSAFVSDTETSGLLGLAASNLNTVTPNKATTFFDTVKSTLPSALFTVELKHDAPGTYTFGFINSTLYTAPITYTPITFANGFWEFNTTGYSIGSTPYTSTIDVIADTGTTLIYLPDTVVTEYYAQVTDATDSATYGGWVFPCNTVLPTFGVEVNGITYTVPSGYLNYAPVSDSICFGGLQTSAGVAFSILGDIFLKSVFAVFDQGNKAIGFAAQAS